MALMVLCFSCTLCVVACAKNGEDRRSKMRQIMGSANVYVLGVRIAMILMLAMYIGVLWIDGMVGSILFAASMFCVVLIKACAKCGYDDATRSRAFTDAREFEEYMKAADSAWRIRSPASAAKMAWAKATKAPLERAPSIKTHLKDEGVELAKAQVKEMSTAIIEGSASTFSSI